MSDVPEADVFEQRTGVRPDDEVPEPHIEPEAPEADAIEQSLIVEDDEDDRPG